MGLVKRLIVAAVPAAMAAGVLLAAPAGAQSQAAGCADTAVFETDGFTHGLDMANWRNSDFNKHVPAGHRIIEVPYYAGVIPVYNRKALDASVAEGVSKLTAAVRGFHASCPGSHLTLAGYSEGAVVAGDVLHKLSASSAIPHSQINGVLYGDPRRPFGDGGLGGVAGGVETNFPTVVPGVTMKGPHEFGDLTVREVCNENDGICNSANMITNMAAFANGLEGYRAGDHGYDLNPVADTGDGLTLHRQKPRIPYGAPLPVKVGTPYQLQQQFGHGAAMQAFDKAATGVMSKLGTNRVSQLNKLPWFQLIKAG